MFGKNRNKRNRNSLSAMAWQRLKRNKLAMMGLLIIVFAAFISILGANVRPDKVKDANTIISQIERQRPGFTILLLSEKNNNVNVSTSFFKRLFFGGDDLVYNKLAIYDYRIEGDEIVYEEFTGTKGSGNYYPTEGRKKLASILYPLDIESEYTLSPDGKEASFNVVDQGKTTISVDEMVNKIEQENIEEFTFWLGTDGLGRDLLSRLMAGTIVSLTVGLVSVLISLVVGIALGAMAGYFRGRIDDIIMWVINVVWSIPTLLLVIAITLALGKGFVQVFIAVGLTMWTEVARVVRGQVMSIREKEFVEAGKALGYSNFRVIFYHVLPNVLSPVIVIAAANFASAILIEAGLSFLGIGAQFPTPSWGAMIAEHRSYITNEGMAYLAVLPGLCIVTLVLAFMLLGNGLRDALDTRSVDNVHSGTA